MTTRRSALMAVGLLVLLLAVVTGQFILSALGSANLADYLFTVSVATFTVVGALIVWKQPTNAVGWAFALVGLLWATGDFSTAFAHYGTEISPGLPGVTLAAWYGEWFWLVWLLLMFFVTPVLFPTGRPLSKRWRVVLWSICGYAALLVGAAMLEEDLQVVGTGKNLRNPIGIEGFHDIETGALEIFVFPWLLLTLVAGLVAIVVRFRRSRGEERQQLKWFAFAVVALVSEFLIQIVLDSVFGIRYEFVDAIFMAFVPASAAIAILRYRLYDVDVVINRTLVYGVLSAVLAGIYVGLVFAFQGLLAPFTAESDLAIAASTLAVAALFRPARTRVQAFIDKRFYRRKVNAQRTLDGFTAELRDEVDLGALSARLTAVVSDTMQPAHVSLWLRAWESVR